MPTTLKFDFYEMIPPKNMEKPYQQILAALGKVAQPVSVEGVPLRVESFRLDGNTAIGSASKTQMDNLPMRIKPTTPGAKDLGLAEGEGLGRPTSFLVTPRGRKILLVLQSNYYGLRIGGFLDMVQFLIGSEPFGMAPIIRASKLQEVLGWHVYRSLTVKVAHPSTKAHYEGETARASVRAAADASAYAVEMRLSLGRVRKGTLSLDSIRTAIRDFRSGEGGRLEKLLVQGSEREDGRAQIVDLIAHRLVEEVAVPGRQRTLSIDTLEAAVQQAYKQATDELVRHFGK